MDPDADPDADPDPLIFVRDLHDVNKKKIFFKVVLLITFEGTFTSFFKDKGINVFLPIFA
jgi:hypothetical protein